MEEKDVVKKWNLVKPASDLYTVICKGRRNKLQKRVLNDLHHYLCGKLVESDEVFDSSVDNNRYSTKDDMIVYLKEKYKTLGEKTNILLREHVKFGKELKRAGKEFMKHRKKWCINDKWEKWIVTIVGISNSYVRRHIQMYDFAKIYPKLLKLNITFTELFKMKTRIENLFSENKDAAEEWKNV